MYDHRRSGLTRPRVCAFLVRVERNGSALCGQKQFRCCEPCLSASQELIASLSSSTVTGTPWAHPEPASNWQHASKQQPPRLRRR